VGKTILKAGVALIIYFFIIGIVCPYLVSAKDPVFVISGIILVLLTSATVPSVGRHFFKGVK